MRWIAFVILTFVVLLVQTSLLRLMKVPLSWGAVWPDLAAIVAVFFALRTRTALDAMLACCILGLGVDLTTGTGGGVGAPTVVGPMAIAYTFTAWALFRARDAFFRDRALTQALLTMSFCLIVYFLWSTMQAIRSPEPVWGTYWLVLRQALVLALYTAVLAPLVHVALSKMERWFLPASSGRTR